ncbi:MAG: exodeoxyribonuclease VII large subunit [Kofleriaceae bacterium]
MLFDSTPPPRGLAPPPASRERPLSVPDLLRRADASLARGVGVVWVEGELTEWKRPASGHAYFTLRDRDAAASMVMWRSDLARARAVPEVGQRVRVRGKLGVYPRDGRMQFYADAIELAGAGDAAAALEALRQKLLAEGLFAAARKRPLPRLPRRIGVCTSVHGAAVRDVIRTIARRYPVPILVVDCAVQGPSAPAQLVAALGRVVAHDVDVVIIGRGGSAGDLAAFNHEHVVRARWWSARCR